MFEQHNYDLAGTVKADIVDFLETNKNQFFNECDFQI